MKTISIRSHQSGAVSLFVVIFATLLITVVTVSFLRLMINDQNQASSNDLSQSAFDSAQAGVEDAKRALLRFRSLCETGTPDACTQLGTDISTDVCNQGLIDVVPGIDIKSSGAGQTGEVEIQQAANNGDSKLDQAYTCVKIKLLTDDYLGSLAANESKLVPLIGKNSDGTTDFDSVTVEWFTTDDIGKSSTGSYVVGVAAPATPPQPLYAQTSWPANRPPVMRAQLMQFGSTFTVGSFDASTSSGESNANTVFMYPTSGGGAAATESFTTDDKRKTDTTPDTPIDIVNFSPRIARCKTSLSAGGYACSTTFTLPAPINGGDRTAFLRISALYNQTHFRVSMKKGGSLTQFNGVQPEVDSTGRANTLFRRVSSRVDLVDTSFTYPDGAVDTSGNLCKDFSVTPTTYIGSSDCTP